MEATKTLSMLRQHELVILRRLRSGPLTEFELAREVAAHSGYSAEAAAENVPAWLESLKEEGLIWSGRLYNNDGQHICAAALTRLGRTMVD